MIWNFFAKGHGKGEVDKVGALLKCEVNKKQIKPNGRNFHNVVEVIAFFKSEANKYHATYPNVR